MLRSGGTISGLTLMALADFATNLKINFLRKGTPGQDVLAAAWLLNLGKRLAVCQSPVRHFTRTYCPCDRHILHSKHLNFFMVV